MQRIAFIFSFLIFTLSAVADTIYIAPGDNALYAAVNESQANDVFVLSDGAYNEANKITILHPLTISAADGAKPILQMKSRIELSADLDVQGLSFEAVDDATEAFRLVPGEEVYSLKIRHTTIKGFSSKTIRLYNTDQSAAYVDSLVIDDCLFLPSAGRCIEASVANKQVQHLLIKNSTFDGGANGVGRLIYFNSEEDTTVESATIDHCTFYLSLIHISEPTRP